MITRTVPALLTDAVLILVFAAIGRSSHAEGLTVGGTLGTAVPFLAGMLLGWLFQWIFEKKPALSVSDGATVWVATVAAGMTIRHLTGEGTALPFIIVATVVLGAFLLGWRVLNRIVARRAPASQRARDQAAQR